MKSVLESLPRGARVAVIRLRSLGDCVLMTPAVELLKRARPDLEVAVVVEERFAAIFEDNPDVSRILPPRVTPLRQFSPYLCVNFHGGSRSLWLTLCSGARRTAGFGHYRFAGLYDFRLPRAQEVLGEERKVHTAEHLALAVIHLGAPRGEIPRARVVATPPASESAYAVIHPMASAADKTWPAARFAQVAGHLRNEMGLEPVFIAGEGEDLSFFRQYRTLADAPLKEVKSMLRGATLFLGNDSGPAHVAAALGLPVVVLFGTSDPAIWGPWRTAAEVLVAPGGAIERISVQEVVRALERLRVAA